MTDTIKFRDDGTVEALLPKELYMAIVRVQAEEELEWNGSCVRAAELIDSGGEKFKKDVKEEARRLHNRELMQELNKGRLTIANNARESALSLAKIRYPCSVCGKDMVWNLLNDEDKEKIMEVLKKGGIANWQHTTCRTPTS